MTPCPVSIGPDTTTGTTVHLAPIPNTDLPAHMNSPPGEYTCVHSFTDCVFHKGSRIATEGHDLGPLLPHAVPELASELRSRRYPVWAASTVQMDGRSTACADAHFPLIACGEVMAPVGDNVSNATHSVMVGMTDLDVDVGMYDALMTVAVTTIAAMTGGNAPNPYTYLLGISWQTTVASAPVSLIRSIYISQHNNWSTPISIRMSAGRGVIGAAREVGYDPRTKRIFVRDSARAPGATVDDGTAVGRDGYHHRGAARTPFSDRRLDWGSPL